MEPSAHPKIPGLGWSRSLLIFGSFALLMFVSTHVLIPWLTRMTSMEVVFWWFVVAGLGVFLPLLLAARVILKAEGWWGKPGMWRERLRFRKMTRGDWLWSIGGIVAIGVLATGVMELLKWTTGGFSHNPPFMAMEPLDPGRYWLMAVWVPYWLLNIGGEEILWRGVLLPRQERTFGRWAWVVHAIGWSMFHIAFGWQLVLTMLPILFVQSYVVSRRKNSWIGVVIHGAINGPTFIAIAFGAM